VEIVLGHKYDQDHLGVDTPDYIIVASGSTSLLPPDWADQARGKACSVNELLASPQLVDGTTVVVIGGGLTGCEAADYLAGNGKRVTLIERQGRLAPTMERKNRRDLLNRLEENGVITKLNSQVTGVERGCLLVTDGQGKTETIDPDNIVFAMGYHPNRDLYEQLRLLHPRVYLVGDAQHIGGIGAAVVQGRKVAEQILKEDEL
jgi:2-enoate reductase